MTVTGRLEQQLQALREAGAAQRDPMRWHYVEVLQRRMQAQPEAVQRLLQDRLGRALEDLASTLAQKSALKAAPKSAQTAAYSASATVRAAGNPATAACAASAAKPAPDTGRTGAAAAPVTGSEPSVLGRLLQDLQAGTPAPQTLRPGTGRRSRLPPENPRVRQFRQQLHRISVKKQVQQAIAQAPPNAGPINSQRLVLQALALMRDIAPDYLQRFMTHVDTLLCLDSAQQARSPTARKKSPRA